MEKSDKRILILSDHLLGAMRIYKAVKNIPGAAVEVLICNNSGSPVRNFRKRQLAASVISSGIPTALNLLLYGRVHFKNKSVNDPEVIAWIREGHFWIGLHNMGTIYRRGAISAFKMGILNAHIGLLPEYRGRSVMEWSILAGNPTGITVFFMDEGIDTGRSIVLKRVVDVKLPSDISSAKEYLFSLDGKMYTAALLKLVSPGFHPEDNNSSGHRYYVMSELFRSAVEMILKESRT